MGKKSVCIKLLSLTLIFITVIGLSVVNLIPLYNQFVVVSVNSSSGEFYETNRYAFSDYLKGNGVCKTYDKNFNYASNIINPLNATIVKTEKIDGIINYYYYSKNLARTVTVDGKRVNLHVAVTSSLITVGYPLIYHAY